MMTIEIKINADPPLAVIEVRRQGAEVHQQQADGTRHVEALYEWALWEQDSGALRKTSGGTLFHVVDAGAEVLAAVVLDQATRHRRPEPAGVKALRMLADLDRCEHGRHAKDECYGCDNVDTGITLPGGNRFLPPGTRIGSDIGGRPYTVPKPGRTGNPDAWVERPS